MVLLWLCAMAVMVMACRTSYLYGKLQGRKDAERDLAETLGVRR